MDLLGRGLGYRVGPHDYVSDPKKDDDLVFEYNVDGEIISETIAVQLEHCMWTLHQELMKQEKEEEEKKEEDEKKEEPIIFQRKIEPWSNLLGFETNLSRQDEYHSRRQRQDIIVVASLIEKAPNLGGLSEPAKFLVLVSSFFRTW